MKICNICNIEYPLSFFQKHKASVGGRIHQCKNCVSAKITQWRLDNPEKYKAQLERAKIVRGTVEDKETFLNRRKKNAMGRAVVSNNYAHRRRLKTVIRDELTDFAFHEASLLRDMRKEVTGIDWHIDHIVPINHKDACGLHVAANFQVVPAYWNRVKRNFTMDKYFG